MREFNLDKIKATGTTVGDLYFPQTSLLLPFNGSDAATSTSDLSNRNGAVSFSGTAQLSTGQSKFGGSSLLLDGNSDYLTISSSYWASAINSGDFTIECWVRYASLSGNQELMGNRGDSGGNSSNGWALRKKATSNNIILYWYEGGQFNYLNNTQGSRTALSVDTWYHVAVTRSGNTWKLFLNGTAEDTVTDSGTMVSSNENRLFIGNFDGLYTNGYIDDLRITVGQARYTSNFTAPTTAHLTSAGDVNKQIIINSAADGVAIGTGGINQARIAKAWCNINGTGTISIRGSYNVSSLTDVGTGKYKVNFSTAMTDSNYVGFVAGAEVNSGTNQNHLFHLKRETPLSDILNTAYIYVASANTANTATDDGLFCVIVFGN